MIAEVTIKPKVHKILTDAASIFSSTWSVNKAGFGARPNPTSKFSSVSPSLSQRRGQLEKNQIKLEVTQLNNQNLARCENSQSSVRSSWSSKEVKTIQTI